MENLFKIGASLYAYCTDFLINMANLTGLSYYEMNAFFFCVLWPFITIVLIVLFIYQKLRDVRSK